MSKALFAPTAPLYDGLNPKEYHLAEELIQKAMLFYSETELGEGAVPFAEGVGSPFLLEQRLRRVKKTLFGTDACVTGYLDDPWEA